MGKYILEIIFKMDVASALNKKGINEVLTYCAEKIITYKAWVAVASYSHFKVYAAPFAVGIALPIRIKVDQVGG